MRFKEFWKSDVRPIFNTYVQLVGWNLSLWTAHWHDLCKHLTEGVVLYFLALSPTDIKAGLGFWLPSGWEFTSATLPGSSCTDPRCKIIHELPSNCVSPVSSPRITRWLCRFLSSGKWKESGMVVKEAMGRRINNAIFLGETSFQRHFVEFENLEIAFFETDNPPGPLGLS